ncbi:hypothetical protein HYW76_02625 [Candidatus Pacearchaeota archaeon]|nr:hypothetical protein [Candidatus Pacearchaeota archaeon]
MKGNFYIACAAPPERDWENKAIMPYLKMIEEGGGQVREMPGGSQLDGFILLPRLEAPNGDRFHGVESIRKYAERYLAR